MSNSPRLSPHPPGMEALRTFPGRLARDSMAEESSHGLTTTAEAEVGNLGTLPGALPGAGSLWGLAPTPSLLTTQGIGAQSGSLSVKDGHLDGSTETENGTKVSAKVAPSLVASDMIEVRKSLASLFSTSNQADDLSFVEAKFAMRHMAILKR